MTIRTLSLSLILFILAGCSREATVSSAPDLPQKLMPGALEAECNKMYNTNARGKRISWKGAVPIAFTIDSSFPAEFVPVVREAMEAWNQAAGYPLFVVRDQAPNVISMIDANDKALRAKLDPTEKDDSHIALTRMAYRGNQMVNARIYFEKQNLSNSLIRLNSYDVSTVTMHELGHALGLDHNLDEITSVMWPSGFSFGFSFRRIDQTSKRLLACEY